MTEVVEAQCGFILLLCQFIPSFPCSWIISRGYNEKKKKPKIEEKGTVLFPKRPPGLQELQPGEGLVTWGDSKNPQINSLRCSKKARMIPLFFKPVAKILPGVWGRVIVNCRVKLICIQDMGGNGKPRSKGGHAEYVWAFLQALQFVPGKLFHFSDSVSPPKVWQC